jgi:hypothetical protein
VGHGVSEKGEVRFVAFGAVLTCATINCVVVCIVEWVGGILIALLNSFKNNTRLYEYIEGFIRI